MARVLRSIAATCALTLVCGCAIAPHFQAKQDKIDAYDRDATLANAAALGRSQRDVYSSMVEDQVMLERWTGVGLVGLATVASNFAIRGVYPHAVLGMGLGAGGLYVGSSYLAGRPLPFIYAAGAMATQCALDSMAPMIRAGEHEGDLRRDVAILRERVRDMDQEIGLARSNDDDPYTVRARLLRERVLAFLPQADRTLRTFRSAGPELRSSLSAIQGQVTMAVLANTQNISELTQQLGTALPAIGGRVIGVTLPSVPPAPTQKGSTPRLTPIVSDIEIALDDAEQIVGLATTAPDVTPLKNCRVDLSQAGISLTVQPDGDLELKAGEPGNLLLSGGVLPYHANWVGARPDDSQVRLDVESGQGVVSVSPKESASGTWKLLLADSAANRHSVQITVRVAARTAATPAPADQSQKTQQQAAAPAACPRPDPALKSLQQRLRDHGVTSATVGGKVKTLAVDGCPGPITSAAMARFDQQNNGGEPLPKTDALVQSEVTTLLDALDKSQAAPAPKPAAAASAAASGAHS